MSDQKKGRVDRSQPKAAGRKPYSTPNPKRVPSATRRTRVRPQKKVVVDPKFQAWIDRLSSDAEQQPDDPVLDNAVIDSLLPPAELLKPQRVSYTDSERRGIILEVVDVPGVYRVRQPSTVDETYNPEGISLLCIELELDRALDPFPTWHVTSLARNYWEQALRGRNPIKDRKLWLRQQSRLMGKENVIDSEDGKRATFIQRYPSALVLSPEHQDAVARWTYAARWSHDPATRNQAKALLKLFRPPPKASHGKTDPSLPQLLLTYNDLCRYFTLIFEAARTLGDKAALLKVFPDVTKLEPHFPDPPKRGAKDKPVEIDPRFRRFVVSSGKEDKPGAGQRYNLDDVVNPKNTKPPASDAAKNYIAAYIGVKPARVRDLITEARSATHSRA